MTNVTWNDKGGPLDTLLPTFQCSLALQAMPILYFGLNGVVPNDEREVTELVAVHVLGALTVQCPSLARCGEVQAATVAEAEGLGHTASGLDGTQFARLATNGDNRAL